MLKAYERLRRHVGGIMTKIAQANRDENPNSMKAAIDEAVLESRAARTRMQPQVI